MKRYPGSPFGEAQKGTSPTSPQGLPGQGASGTSSMILPPDKLTGWHPTSSMPGRRDISGCDLTSSTTASPCPLHPPVLANLPQPTKTSRKGCKLAGALTSLTEKCGMAMWELWQQNPHRIQTEPQQNPNKSPREHVGVRGQQPSKTVRRRVPTTPRDTEDKEGAPGTSQPEDLCLVLVVRSRVDISCLKR